MKTLAVVFIAIISLSFISCSAEQEVIAADKNLKSYKEMDFLKQWNKLEYRKNIQQNIQKQK